MSYDPDHRTIAIYQDKSTLLKSVLPSLFGGLVVFPILLYRHSRKRVLKLMALLAGVILLLWKRCFSLPSLGSFFRVLSLWSVIGG